MYMSCICRKEYRACCSLWRSTSRTFLENKSLPTIHFSSGHSRTCWTCEIRPMMYDPLIIRLFDYVYIHFVYMLLNKAFSLQDGSSQFRGGARHCSSDGDGRATVGGHLPTAVLAVLQLGDWRRRPAIETPSHCLLQIVSQVCIFSGCWSCLRLDLLSYRIFFQTFWEIEEFVQPVYWSQHFNSVSSAAR